MHIHKRTKLTPIQRQEVYDGYYLKRIRVCDLMRQYQVSSPVIYKILERGRNRDFSIHRSTNERFRCLQYGLKRLAKVEHEIEEKRKREAKRYNKKYPGEMIHGDTKRLPLLKGDSATSQREYLFVAIDDYSRELYAAILPDKTQWSAKTFLEQVIDECPYTIEKFYTDNGKEYKGDPAKHTFMQLCQSSRIEQGFTQVKRPQTNGKAERVIRTIMEMWHERTEFRSSAHRKQELIRFINYYNTVKPHASLDDMTPYEYLIQYFYPDKL